MSGPDKSSKDTKNQQNFVLVDTDHPEISSNTVPDGQIRRAPGNRQSATESGSRQGGSDLGTEGGAPGPEASSGV